MDGTKQNILESIGKALPDMTEQEKTYLMGFVEGIAAIAGTARLAERPGA